MKMKTFTREQLRNNVRDFEKEEKLKPLKNQFSKILNEMYRLSLMGIVEYNHCVGGYNQEQLNYIMGELTNRGFGYTTHDIGHTKYILISWA